MPPTTSASLDSNTRVQFGILVTLITAFTGAAWWAAGMTRDVAAVRENSDKMTAATLRLESLGLEHARMLVAMGKDVEALERRIAVLESKIGR